MSGNTFKAKQKKNRWPNANFLQQPKLHFRWMSKCVSYLTWIEFGKNTTKRQTWKVGDKLTDIPRKLNALTILHEVTYKMVLGISKVPMYLTPHCYGRPFVSKLWHDIYAVFSHVYLQSFLLHDIRAFFATYTCVLFYKRAYICAQKSPYICVTNKHVVYGVHRKSSYKRHRIVPSAKNPFMYDAAKK